jgi:hypothetical protein
MKLKPFLLALLIGLGTLFTTMANGQDKNPEVVRTLKPFKAKVVVIIDNYTLVPVDDDSKRYLDGNMDAKYKKEGTVVIVSGDELKPPPNVRILAAPFRIKTIELADGSEKPRNINTQEPQKDKTEGKTEGKSGRDMGKQDTTDKANDTGYPVLARWGDKVNDLEGAISKINDDMYIIKTADTQYYPLNLTNEFKVDGIKVKFNGKMGVPKPNVRLPGTPISLTSIERVGSALEKTTNETEEESWWDWLFFWR